MKELVYYIVREFHYWKREAQRTRLYYKLLQTALDNRIEAIEHEKAIL